MQRSAPVKVEPAPVDKQKPIQEPVVVQQQKEPIVDIMGNQSNPPKEDFFSQANPFEDISVDVKKEEAKNDDLIDQFGGLSMVEQKDEKQEQPVVFDFAATNNNDNQNQNQLNDLFGDLNQQQQNVDTDKQAFDSYFDPFAGTE